LGAGAAGLHRPPEQVLVERLDAPEAVARSAQGPDRPAPAREAVLRGLWVQR
jgi:hypothetical protein